MDTVAPRSDIGVPSLITRALGTSALDTGDEKVSLTSGPCALVSACEFRNTGNSSLLEEGILWRSLSCS